MIKLLRKFIAKFVQASIIAQHKDITKVPYDERDKQLSNDILAVGSSNRTFLIDHADDLSPSLLDKFFRYVHVYSIISSIKIYIHYFKCKNNTIFKYLFQHHQGILHGCNQENAVKVPFP